MATSTVYDQYFAYEARLASFQTAQPLAKRRTSNASSRAPKTMKWPHKSMSPEEFANAGFFYYPGQANPDNAVCFLCHYSLDGWEENDDPLVEHLKHSPDCGWAIVAAIGRQDEELSSEYPSSTRMIAARKATFTNKWPHEGKKGWKCKVKQMVDAGWKYTPTAESDDMATCTYCELGLDGWEPSDKPLDEHFNRSPECPFFQLINNHKRSPAAKRNKRTSKISRLSTQSSITAASEAPSFADLPAEEGDSILTTATNTTRNMGKSKKAPAKGRKTRAKKGEPTEVVAHPEPEDDGFEVQVDIAPKLARGKKRKSEQEDNMADITMESTAPPPKRRATRTRGSAAVDDSMALTVEDVPHANSQPKARKGRSSTKPPRKASNASVAPLKTLVPNDDEIDAALEADLERHLTDDECQLSKSIAPPKKGTRPTRVTKADHSMFGIEPAEIDEAAIEAELEAMEVDSKPLPKAKGAKGKTQRKPSAKQQAAAKKAAEAEAQREADEDASRQIADQLEQSISLHHSSPIIQPKRQRATSRQPTRKVSARTTGNSRLSMNSDFNASVAPHEDDPGNETDDSMASQSTVVRGGSNRRGSTMKKGKKAASRNIEEILYKSSQTTSITQPEASGIPMNGRIMSQSGMSTTEENFHTPAPESVEEEPIRSTPIVDAPEPSAAVETSDDVSILKNGSSSQSKTKSAKAKVVVELPRSPTPPPKESTPSESPQSSDAENHPPSSKPSAATKKIATPHSTRKRSPLAAMTPAMSPSKRNIMTGLQTLHPWTSVDLDTVLANSPGGEHGVGNLRDILGEEMERAKSGILTSPEKKMSVEEWIHYNAELAEQRLKTECERMVSSFESQGTRAMVALEGIECLD
ncbi:uncharacterized protein BP5553_08164 [Venustampulla echinocandica]|uniref:BIR-domain-containing protein n=1 Tax=Venustampulla echinocandica TaxID=2656787 RepID=A0A370TFX1_9HELO|nr:uncharacterized protein BP5553_08164 [Venustampulla echinocandica]RDL33796.1 hypothetical protein BP5553_08164 [Venustampulla echinocandica]